MTTLQTVKQTIEANQLLVKGHSVLVALSGGPDSVALLHLLSRLRRSYRLKLSAVYINHQIRPRAAKKEEKFCQLLCDELSVPLTIVREDVPALAKKRGLGLEETARDVRYAIFDSLVKAGKYDRVALGHHADDQVETILFRLVRGTGPFGMTGMPVKRGKYIRPLLELTRSEILGYLKKYSLCWCEDASNKSLKFRRNWIRHRLLPGLRKNLNPKADAAILALAALLAEDEAYLGSIVDRAVRKTVRMTPGGKIALALGTYRGYPVSLRHRLLRYCLKATCMSESTLGREAVQRLDRLAMNGGGAISLPGRVQASVAGPTMYLWVRGAVDVHEELTPGKSLNLDWPAVKFTSRLEKPARIGASKSTGGSRIRLDWDKLKPPLVVRTIRPGDRFRPLGMKGHKKVGDFLTDRKVPRPLRDEVLLLCDQAGPVWVAGYEIADRVKIDVRTGKVLRVAFSVRQKKVRPAV
jgi:tRNA(Ile)-lysidine synthase